MASHGAQVILDASSVVVGKWWFIGSTLSSNQRRNATSEGMQPETIEYC